MEVRGRDYTQTNCDEQTLENTTFTDCKFALASFKGTSISNVLFKRCKIVGIDFSQVRTAFFSANFEECELQQCSFAHMDLRNTSFANSSFHDCSFISVSLMKADFSSCRFSQTDFLQCNLSKANFSNAQGYQISPLNNRLDGAKFSYPEVLSLLGEFNLEID